MVTYTDPVQKQWVMDSKEDFLAGTIDGTELDNPNYSGKIVVECLLGDNLLNTQERPWNPSFEDKHPTEERPYHWSFEFPSTGSYYQQDDPEGAYDGLDYVVIRDESNEANQRGRLVLDPEGVPDPEHLNIVVNPQKTYTVRYHGRYVKAGPGEDRGPVGRVGVKDDAEPTDVREFEPFVAMEASTGTWQEADYRITPSEAQDRKIMLLKLFFGGTNERVSFPELSWAIDQVEVAETFPATPEYLVQGVYTSPVLYTPPTLSKVTWGQFNPTVATPENTAVDFYVRVYDALGRVWSPWIPIAPEGDITEAADSCPSLDTDMLTRMQWMAVLKWTGANPPATATAQVDAVTINYAEQFRTDHPRIWFESGDIAALVSKINTNQATQDEYQALKVFADEVKTEDPPEYTVRDNEFLKNLRYIRGAALFYVLGIEEDADDYAAGAAVWTQNLLTRAPFFIQVGAKPLNEEFYGGNRVEFPGRQQALAHTLGMFRDWCHDYITDPAHGLGALVGDVEETLLQISYYGYNWFTNHVGSFVPDNRFIELYGNFLWPMFALWDNADVYDIEYEPAAEWPMLPVRTLARNGEEFNVEQHIAYMEEHFGDGGQPVGGGYGSGYLNWATRFFKAWKTAMGENWFLKAGYFRKQALYELYRLLPNCTWEKMSSGDGSSKIYSGPVSPQLAAIGSEFDADGSGIGPVLRYMTEYKIKWEPLSMADVRELVRRILWRDPSGAQTAPEQAGLPLAAFFPSRGEAFMRSKWEFDPAGEYTTHQYYYGFPRGTGKKAVAVAFKSGPALTGHNHADQNCFTIYAQGQLAVDSGMIDTAIVGNYIHHDNYFARTIAHNAALIFEATEHYPHIFTPEVAPGIPVENDGGQIWWAVEDTLLKTGGAINYDRFFKYKKYKDAGKLERYDSRTEYDYCFGRATVAYNAYDIYDQPYFVKCGLATRELVFVKPFGPYVPESEDVYAHFVVVYDEVEAIFASDNAANASRWVIHAVEKPAVQTSLGWQSPSGPSAGWIPDNDLGIFRLDAWYDLGPPETEYDGRLFGLTLFPSPGGRELKVIGGQDGEEDYRFFVNGLNFPPGEGAEPHPTDGNWRVEVNVAASTTPNPKFLHVLWPASNQEEGAVSCEYLTYGDPVNFRAAFIRPQEGENAGTLHHVVGFGDLNASGVTYEVDIETHTNHIICRLQQNTVYSVTITNLDTQQVAEPFDVVTTEAGIVRFDRDPLGQPGNHKFEISIPGVPE